jgi:hypothetical protein
LAGGREQTVVVGHEPDQQQTGHEHEWRPVLGRGGARRTGIENGSKEGADASGAGEQPSPPRRVDFDGADSRDELRTY